MNWLEQEKEDRKRKAFFIAILAPIYIPLTFILILYIIGLLQTLYNMIFN